MVLPRVLTAIALIPFVIATVWYGSLPFFLFVLGLGIICVWEFSLIANEGGYPNQMGVAILGVLGIMLALFFDGVPNGPIRHVPSVPFIIVLWTFIIFLREMIRKDKQYSLLRMMTTLFGGLICAFFLGHLLLIRDLKLVMGEGFQPIGKELVFFLILIIWTVDSGAWFVGRSFGRFSLSATISPKKTWEGAIGGTLLACLVGWFLREAFLREALGPLQAIFIAGMIAITAQVSDLLESLMKRSFGVKDSSQLLPGHGGLLDRFDSFIFAAPFFYYLLIATGHFR